MHDFSGDSNHRALYQQKKSNHGATKMELEEFHHSNKKRTLEERIFEWNVLLAL
jgi:hypothetical protein